MQKRSEYQDLIPRHLNAAFTGSITIDARVHLDNVDIESLAKFAKAEHNLLLDKDALDREISVERRIDFKDSNLVRVSSLWSLKPKLRKPKEKKYRQYESRNNATRSVWVSLINHLGERIPKIVYFPTFLFSFPDRIYLDGPSIESTEYYRNIIQDILRNGGQKLSVEKHIVDRVKLQRGKHAEPATFYSYLLGLDEKRQIDSVVAAISNEMSRTVFGAWNDILGRKLSGKRVQVDWGIDASNGNSIYLEVSIIDGQSRYKITERSLGFRWFFSFLLFTQFRFRDAEGHPLIFVFDEPAANLHSKAQLKLLETFAKIANGGTCIVYSTHSHYMINPEWLEKAYIVENGAVNHEDEDEITSFKVVDTSVKATRYRRFVAQNPTKTTYFQPVLDALDFGLSPLERSSKALIVEGKFDYAPTRYLTRNEEFSDGFNIYPASGAGDINTLVNLFKGWAIDFRVLFDGDKAGVDGQKRCQKECLLTDKQALNLGDLHPILSGKTFEDMYKQDVRDAAQVHFGTDNVNKRQLSMFFSAPHRYWLGRTFP